MHVLYIHQYFTTPYQGGGTRSYEFARRLVTWGHRVTMLAGCAPSCGGPLVEEVEGIRVVRAPVPYSNFMDYRIRISSFVRFAAWATLSGLRVEKFDLVFATSTPLTVAVPGLLLSAARRVPFVFEVRDLWPEIPIQMGIIRNKLLIRLLELFEGFVYDRAAHVVALSPGMAEHVLSHGVAPDKVSLIPNCSDLHLFGAAPLDTGEGNKWESRRPFVLYAGAVSRANGLEVLLDACERLQNCGCKASVIVAGDGHMRPVLEAHVSKRGLQNILFTGPLSKYDVARLHNLATGCLVLFHNVPVLSTCSPNKFFDALAAGRPVITNVRGWVADLVRSHNIGFVVPASDSEALAAAIRELCEAPLPSIAAMGQRAKALAEESFDRDKLAKRLEDALVEVIRKCRSRRKRCR